MRCTLIALSLALIGLLFAPAGSTDDLPSLRDSYNSGLQHQLEAVVSRLGLTRASHEGRLAVALVDITNPSSPRAAAINGNLMMFAASLPKIAILYAAFVEINNGRLKLDSVTRNALTRMIRVSSNADATFMLDRIGKKRIAEILQSKPYRFYDPAFNGGLWVGKEYARGVAFRRDPLHHISQGATVMQTARFYYLLDTQRLVSPRYSAIMKEMLGKPGINHKFVKGLRSRPGAVIYRKSGTWHQWHADSALVEHDGYKFIAVALAHDPAGGRWLEQLITPMHDLIVKPRYAAASHLAAN